MWKAGGDVGAAAPCIPPYTQLISAGGCRAGRLHNQSWPQPGHGCTRPRLPPQSPGPASQPGSQPNPALHFFTQSHSSTSYTHHCNFEHDAATGDWFSRKSAFIPETFSASLIYVSFYHRNFLSLVGGWVDVGGWSASQSAPAAGRY